MRNKNVRINLYYKLFGLNCRATAGRRINKQNGLKPYEVFFSMLSNNDIQKLLDFINGSTTQLDMKIKKNRKTNSFDTSMIQQDELITLCTLDEVSYKIYKPLHLTDEEALQEYIIDREYKQRGYEEDDKYIEAIEYAYENLHTQNEFISVEAYAEFLLGNIESAYEIEEQWRKRENIESIKKHQEPKVEIIENYGKYLYYKNLFQKNIEIIFPNEVSTLNTDQSLNYILDDFFSILRTKYEYDIDEEEINDIFPSQLLHYIVKEKFLNLLETYRVKYL